MGLPEIQRHALALPEGDRASLTAALLETLPPPGMDISDDEVANRERELDSAEIEAISHDEFTRRVQRERGR